jgi:hypothetical protein
MKRTIIGVFESGIWEKTAKVDEWVLFGMEASQAARPEEKDNK